MKRYILYGFIISVQLMSCNNKSEPLDKAQKEIIVSEVHLMFDDYHTAIKKEGLKSEFKYLDSSSNFFWVPPGYSAPLSYDSVQSILLINAKGINSIEFTWDTLQVFPLTNSIASYSGVVNGVMIDTSNTQSTFKIIESGTVIKRKTGWKLLNGQSRNLPATKN